MKKEFGQIYLALGERWFEKEIWARRRQPRDVGSLRWWFMNWWTQQEEKRAEKDHTFELLNKCIINHSIFDLWGRGQWINLLLSSEATLTARSLSTTPLFPVSKKSKEERKKKQDKKSRSSTGLVFAVTLSQGWLQERWALHEGGQSPPSRRSRCRGASQAATHACQRCCQPSIKDTHTWEQQHNQKRGHTSDR